MLLLTGCTYSVYDENIESNGLDSVYKYTLFNTKLEGRVTIEKLQADGYGLNKSRLTYDSFFDYILSMSDEELDELVSNLYTKQDSIYFESRLDTTIDSLSAMTSYKDVSNLINVTSRYIEEGGNNPDLLINNSKSLASPLQPIAVRIGATADAITGTCFLESNENNTKTMTCAGKLAFDLGGILLVGCADAALGGYTGQFEITVVGINCTVIQIADALARYKWCKRTGHFL